MSPNSAPTKIIIFDTTMRDGEMMPNVKMNRHQKMEIAMLLEEIGVDVIEVGYPGGFEKDFDEIFEISKQIKRATICGLAGSKPEEIFSVAAALKPAANGRIHVYTPVNLPSHLQENIEQTLEIIRGSVALAKNACADVEWSAFDAARSDPDFLCRAVEVAIKSGASTVSIPDSLGTCSPEEFSALIAMLFNRVPNIDRALVSVHCHNDLGLAVENSIAALHCGARQIECSINGLGARKGNADLGEMVEAIANHPSYQINVDLTLLNKASQLVTGITGIAKSNKIHQ
jgi:2-isopropylmalate synthase